jgi:hypothetical protein
MDDAKRAYVLALYAAGRSSFEIAVETALPQAEVFRVLLDNAAPRCTEEPRFDRYEPAAWVRLGMARSPTGQSGALMKYRRSVATSLSRLSCPRW